MPSFNYDLNALPAAVMIYDRNEHLVAWNHSVALFYPVITPWLKAGTPLEELAERFIEAVYNVDPGLRQTLRESIVRNCRQDKHCEVRQAGQRRIFVQHQRLADGSIVSLHSDITELDEAQRSRHRLHDDFLLTAESIHIGIWDWQVSGDTLQVNDTLLSMLGQSRMRWHYPVRFCSIRFMRTIALRCARHCRPQNRTTVRSSNVKSAFITPQKGYAGCCCPARW